MNKLWVITCLFSPADFRSPLRNYHLFAERLRKQGVPLLTVELAFQDRQFRLPEAKDVLRLRSQSVLWQKECLLNFAASRLPLSCSQVLWADADVLFEDGFEESVGQALSTYHVVQAFNSAYRLFPEQTDFTLVNPWGESLWNEDAVMSREASGQPLNDASFGFAWAARRDFFKLGLYERAILGGGDTLLFNALTGRGQPTYTDIARWNDRVAGRKFKVGFAKNRVCHLWHGELERRRYEDRHEILFKHNFNPSTDLFKINHVLEWASFKPSLHSDIQAYFNGRCEDG